jgi:hypothetical protein
VPERHVLLIGLTRDARTRTARLLATVLQRPFAEADEVLELSTGSSLSRLQRERGEADVRRIEGRLVAELLGRWGLLVMSAPETLDVGCELRSVVADSAVVFWLRDRARPAEPSAVGQELADRVVDIAALQPVHGDPAPLIVGHILELLAGGDRPGPVRLPGPILAAIADGDEADPPRLDDALAVLCHELADMIVDVESFHSGDNDATPAIVRHIADRLALGETDADAAGDAEE